MRSHFSAAGFRLALRSSLETTVLQRSGYLLETLGLRALSRAVAKALSDRRLQATHRLPVFRSAVDQPAGPSSARDRKSTRLTPVTNAHLVCRLLLEKKKKTTQTVTMHA